MAVPMDQLAELVLRDAPGGRNIELGASSRFAARRGADGRSRVFWQVRDATRRKWKTVWFVDDRGDMFIRGAVTQAATMNTREYEPQD